MADGTAKRRRELTLQDLERLERCFKEARKRYEELHKAGDGGAFDICGVDALETYAVTVPAKPRTPYQRFYFQVTSKPVLKWLAETYGGVRLRALLAEARNEPGLCKLNTTV